MKRYRICPSLSLPLFCTSNLRFQVLKSWHTWINTVNIPSWMFAFTLQNSAFDNLLHDYLSLTFVLLVLLFMYMRAGVNIALLFSYLCLPIFKRTLSLATVISTLHARPVSLEDATWNLLVRPNDLQNMIRPWLWKLGLRAITSSNDALSSSRMSQPRANHSFLSAFWAVLACLAERYSFLFPFPHPLLLHLTGLQVSRRGHSLLHAISG